MNATHDDDDHEIVPFGKYRGRPVTHLLADQSYVEWLRAQPWLQRSQPNIYNVIIGGGQNESNDTPEHNAMQARYLDAQQRARLAVEFLPSREQLVEEAASYRRVATQSQLDNLAQDEEAFHVSTSPPKFEVDGWDVTFRASVRLDPPRPKADVPSIAADCPWCAPTEHTTNCDSAREQAARRMRVINDAAYKFDLPKLSAQDTRPDPADCPTCRSQVKHEGECPRATGGWSALLTPVGDQVLLRIELKPAITDDYPAVLRQVIGRRQQQLARNNWQGIDTRAVVVTDRLRPSSVTPAQVKAIFESQSVDLVETSELGELLAIEAP